MTRITKTGVFDPANAEAAKDWQGISINARARARARLEPG